MKKLIICLLLIILILSTICGCANNNNNIINPTESQNDERAEILSKFIQHEYKNISFKAPSNWIKENKSDNYYLYLKDDFFMIQAIDVDYTPMNKNGIYDLDGLYYNALIDGINKSISSECVIDFDKEKEINSNIFHHYILKSKITNKQIYISLYLVYNTGCLYEFFFTTYGEKSNPVFDLIEEDLLSTITFNNNYLSPTEKPTELPTEVPTDAPMIAETETLKYGSVYDPAPLGKTIEVYDKDRTILDMSISNVISGDEAYKRIVEYNQFNNAPVDGYHYVLFDVNVECKSTNASDGYEIKHFSFYAANSTKAILKNSRVSVVLDDPLDVTLFPGSSATGQVAVLMPNNGDGYIVFNNTYFFALQ